MGRIIFYLNLFLFPFVMVSQNVRTSVQNGNFNVNATWDCGCVPSSTDTIVVDAGDTVFLVANTSIGGVVINSSGQLDNSGNRLDVYGNYIVNGTHTGSGLIYMLGTNTYMDGVGLISNGSNFDIRADGIYIRKGAFLVKSGGGRFRIRGARTFTNYGYFATTRDITGNNASSTFHNQTGGFLDGGRVMLSTGILIANDSGNTVRYSRSGNQVIKQPQNNEYYNLKIDGSQNKRLQFNNLIVLNDFEQSGGIFETNGNDIQVRGDFTQTGGTFNEGTSVITFNGDEDQTLTGPFELTLYDITINKSSGNIYLGSRVTATNATVLTNGLVFANDFPLTIGSSTTVTGSISRTNGYVVGTISRWISTGMANYNYPLGNSTDYRPASIAFTAANSGRLNVRFSSLYPGKLGLPVGDGADTVQNLFVEGYWAFSDTSGLTSPAYNVTLTANNFTSYTINSATRALSRANEAANWTANGSHAAASSPNVFRNGLSAFPLEFAIGDTTKCTLPSPSTSQITGADTVCKSTSASSYSVVNTPGATYTWEIVGGVQASGGNSNTITVNWGAQGIVGSVKVTEYNGCEYGEPVTKNVAITPFDPTAISGFDNGYEGTTNNVYHVDEYSGYTYNWFISSLANRTNVPIDNDTALLTFNAAGIVELRASYTNGCGNSDTVTKFVTVITPIKSITSGTYASTSTWDCGCNPGNNSSVQIMAGHTVTSNVSNERAQDIIVDSLGTLVNNSGIRLKRALYNRGTITGAGDIRLDGNGTYVGGDGDWSGVTGDFNFQNGTHDIISDANVVFAGNINMTTQAVVFNEGLISTTGSVIADNNSEWHQEIGSTLQFSDITFPGNSFYVSAENNTVIYSGSGTFTRTMEYPILGEYYNLVIDGDNVNGIYEMAGGNFTLQNLTIRGGTMSTSASNLRISIGGNWNAYGGVFDPQQGKVIFAGSDQFITNAGGGSFYDLFIDEGSGTIQMTSDLHVENDFNINTTHTLDMNDTNNYDFRIQGRLFNDGAINFYENELRMDGSAAQTIQGPISPYDLSFDNSAGLSIDTIVTLRHNLDIKNGTITTNGNLTMVSTATETAKILDLTGGGSITGDVTVQRYLNEGFGWYMLASPVTGSNLYDWNQEIYMSGFPGSDGGAQGFISVQRYDQSTRGVGNPIDSGYIYPTDSSEALNPGDGWFVYYQTVKPGITANTMDVVGPLYTGAYNTGTLLYTNSGASTDNGWHMVGNPYASPVEFNSLALNSINNSTGFVKRSGSGNYWDIVNDNIDYLYSSEAMWVQVNSGGGSIGFTESDKADVVDSYNQRKAKGDVYMQPLKLTLTQSAYPGYYDYSVIRFGEEKFTEGYESFKGESRKISNSYGYLPNIASYDKSQDADIYYNTLDEDIGDVVIPLRAWTTLDYNYVADYQLTFEGIDAWYEHNHCLFLADSMSGTTQRIDASNSNYNWSVIDTITEPYLFLNHTSPIESSQEEISCFGAEDGVLRAQGSGSMNGLHDYIWLDANGNVIKSETAISGMSVLEGVAAGIYQVEVSGNGACGTMSQTFELRDPDPVVAIFEAPALVEKETEFEFINTSANALNYEWDFGDGNISNEENPSHTYIDAGMYQVSLKAFQSEQCFNITTRNIEVKDYTSIEDLTQVDENLLVFGYHNSVYIQGEFDSKEHVQVNIFNGMGQQVHTTEYFGVHSLNEQIPLGDAHGLYLVNVQTSTENKVYKVMLY